MCTSSARRCGAHGSRTSTSTARSATLPHINGVDVGALIEAELDHRHPERTKLPPTGADGFREAWTIIERAWSSTVNRARALPPALLHERVDDEWSFIETLRHLLFATDAWLLRAFLGRSDPYTPLDLPHTEMEADPSVPNDPDARPSLDDVLALRAERMAIVGSTLAGLTDTVLAGDTDRSRHPATPRRAPTPFPDASARCSTKNGCTVCSRSASSPSSKGAATHRTPEPTRRPRRRHANWRQQVVGSRGSPCAQTRRNRRASPSFWAAGGGRVDAQSDQ
jgi:hypothetical protein